MVRRLIVRRDSYFDSVFLMHAAREIAAEPGITDAAVLMATDANRAILADMGYEPVALSGAGPNDLVFAAEGEEAAVRAALADPGRWLVRRTEADAAQVRVRTLDQAKALRPAANVAVISVPGAHAAREARKALALDLNVFLFSSNVSLGEEIALKREARDRGLIVMGPDCGTAIVGGVGIGFANAVRRGPVGVVAASGTGLQELTCLIHRGGSGISHAIGTGSHDLSEEVGGLSTFAALDALESDSAMEIVAVVGKPPAARVLGELVRRLERFRTPVVLCLLGAAPAAAGSARLRFARTIDEAARDCLEAVGVSGASEASSAAGPVAAPAAGEVHRMARSQRFVRGIFAGGTFCYQAQLIARDAGIVGWSNAPLECMRRLPDPLCSREHSFVDMGAEELVQGRAHPMIDAALRRRRVAVEAEDPEVAVLLLDFVLGRISSPDPAGDLAETIARGRELAGRQGRYLAVVASVCGTELDAQHLDSQVHVLQQAGAAVFPSAEQAARSAVQIACALQGR